MVRARVNVMVRVKLVVYVRRQGNTVATEGSPIMPLCVPYSYLYPYLYLY